MLGFFLLLLNQGNVKGVSLFFVNPSLDTGRKKNGGVEKDKQRDDRLSVNSAGQSYYNQANNINKLYQSLGGV